MVQWSRLSSPKAQGPSSIPGEGTKIIYASQGGLKKNIKWPTKVQNIFAVEVDSLFSCFSKFTFFYLLFFWEENESAWLKWVSPKDFHW